MMLVGVSCSSEQCYHARQIAIILAAIGSVLTVGLGL